MEHKEISKLPVLKNDVSIAPVHLCIECKHRKGFHVDEPAWESDMPEGLYGCHILYKKPHIINRDGSWVGNIMGSRREDYKKHATRYAAKYNEWKYGCERDTCLAYSRNTIDPVTGQLENDEVKQCGEIRKEQPYMCDMYEAKAKSVKHKALKRKVFKASAVGAVLYFLIDILMMMF